MSPAYPVLTKAPHLSHVMLAKDQPEYTKLPALVGDGPYGVVTTRWKFSLSERIRVMLFGNLWVQLMTFCLAVQPVKLATKEPTRDECL